jgi:hypothetical protein
MKNIDCVSINEPYGGHLQDNAVTFGEQSRDYSLQFVRPWLGNLTLEVKDHFVIRQITRNSEQDSLPFRPKMAIERPDRDEKSDV